MKSDVKLGDWLSDSSRPARGAWVEIRRFNRRRINAKSRPARGAWVEIFDNYCIVSNHGVAPRKGRVG